MRAAGDGEVEQRLRRTVAEVVDARDPREADEQVDIDSAERP